MWPTGLIVNQSYNTLSDIKISLFNDNKYIYTIKHNIKNVIHTRKNIRVFMPNLIHSLDATSLSMLINNYVNMYENEIKFIFGIYDCFSTHC
jgi:DNA-directed RNA polymerase